MKKVIIFSIIMLSCVVWLSAQSSDSIIIEKKGRVLKYHGQVVAAKVLPDIMKDNPKAIEELSKSKLPATAANLLMGTGLAIMGVGILTQNLILQLAGLGVECIGIPFSMNAKKHRLNAVSIYNSGVK